MGAIVVAMVVGLVAVGLVVGIVIFSALALAGMKAVNAAHESRSWFVNRRRS
ncbi:MULTISPECIES: hypothetical protein [Saccharopolyspora]|uniref:Uncharacterized protein n=1 Tax=Saccharopolyspora shandongensis TaxID=418495 RepID=A0A1H3BW65_9PSEU|nr:hypothetical protein [Saccharopolyspora shandongensis]SDX45975.1 hypothetical protein SAMN05216215_101182 [Saccharopolyspora shandongensis]